jgi:LysM repeat protein
MQGKEYVMANTRPAWRLRRLLLTVGLLLAMTGALPSAALAAPAQSEPGQERWVRVYTVRPGDTLGSIALKYGVTVEALMEANNLRNPNVIVVGQDLVIPETGAGKPGTGGPACADYHVVRRGETLSGIAYAYGLEPYTLARANGIYDLNEIYVGQQLCIPAKGGAPKPAPEPQKPEPKPEPEPRGEPQPPADGPQQPNHPPDGPQRPPEQDGPQQPGDGPQQPDGPNRPPDGRPGGPPDGPNDGPHDGPDDGDKRPSHSDQYWKGSYFRDKYFAEFVEERKDAEIRFNWYKGKPFEGMPEDRFSVRWEKVEFFQSGWYRFKATSDDGVRVYVDDQLVIDGWKIQPATEYKGEIFLHEGGHKLVVEYYEEAEDALITVEWEGIRRDR